MTASSSEGAAAARRRKSIDAVVTVGLLSR
jgi:hypothetical protein